MWQDFDGVFLVWHWFLAGTGTQVQILEQRKNILLSHSLGDLYAPTNKTAQMATGHINQRGPDQFWQFLSLDTISIKCSPRKYQCYKLQIKFLGTPQKMYFHRSTKNPISISRKIFSAVKPNSRGGGWRMRKDYQFSSEGTSHRSPVLIKVSRCGVRKRGLGIGFVWIHAPA